MPRRTILVVDPEQAIADTMALALSTFKDEFLAIGMTSLEEARHLLKGLIPNIVVLAAMFPNVSELEHAIELRQKFGCKVLLMSAYPEAAEALEYIYIQSHGQERFEILAKPIHPSELVEKIKRDAWGF